MAVRWQPPVEVMADKLMRYTRALRLEESLRKINEIRRIEKWKGQVIERGGPPKR